MTFTHICLTAPNKSIAEIYDQQLQRLSKRLSIFRSCSFTCIADPRGVRIGSGGGTLNAIDQVAQKIGSRDLSEAKILIIHSGGDSRRAPLHSICGKAWATLNSIVDDEIASPLLLLMSELTAFCENVPLGSVVIACSDVLLDIHMSHAAPEIPNDSIAVVVVPESPNVAKNHGVIVEGLTVPNTNTHAQQPYKVSRAVLYLQKPSVESMRSKGALRCHVMSDASTADPGTDAETETETALIDTGVIIVTGIALQRLVSLLESPVIRRCTESGLRELSTDLSTLQFPSTNPQGELVALRLELYSELLLPLVMNNQPCELTEFYSRLGFAESGPVVTDSASALYAQSLSELWALLRDVPLFAITIERGQFYHLGTSMELLELVSEGSVDDVLGRGSQSVRGGTSSIDATKISMNTKIEKFSRKYCLKRDLKSFSCSPWADTAADAVHAPDSTVPDSTGGKAPAINGVVINSYLSPYGSCEPGSLVEHSSLLGNFCIGRGAVASHLRGAASHDIILLPGIMAQLIPLSPSVMRQHFSRDPSTVDNSAYNNAAVLLLMSSADDVKAAVKVSSRSTICGIEWKVLFEATPVQASDVWPAALSDSERTLWTAEIFEVFDIDRSSSTLFILQNYINKDAGITDELWNEWLSKRRLSLSDLLSHGLGDAGCMFRWRWLLQTRGKSACGSFYNGDAAMARLSRCYGWVHSAIHEVVGASLPILVDVSVATQELLFLWLIALSSNRALPVFDIASDSLEVTFDKALQVLSKTNPSLVVGTSVSTVVGQRWKTYVNDLSEKSFNAGDDSSVLPSQALTLLADGCDKQSVRTVLIAYLEFLSVSKDLNRESIPRLLLLAAWLASHAQLLAVADLDVSSEELIAAVPFDCCRFVAHLKGLVSTSCCANDITNEPLKLPSLQYQLETLAQRIVRDHVQISLKANLGVLTNPPFKAVDGDIDKGCETISIARAPVRIDIAGGWSDTPPICYQCDGGAVLNVSVLVDGLHPISCASRTLSTPTLRLVSLLRKSIETSVVGVGVGSSLSIDAFEREVEEMSFPCSFSLPINPQAKCSLLKACLVALDIVQSADSRTEPRVCKELRGLEVVSCSTLPPGSGMGGSSVLAATVLRSLTELLDCHVDDLMLVYLVSHVEQILSTGGGWQDQVGSIYGGFKIGRSSVGLPVRLQVQTLPCSPAFIAAFNARVCIVFTGTQRLAKNTLMNALRGFAQAPPGCGVVSALVRGANEGAAALLSAYQGSGLTSSEVESAHQALNALANTLTRYWDLKKQMAEGSEPDTIRRILLQLQPVCVGLSLCGAGAGGYAVLVLKETHCFEDVQACVQDMVDRGFGSTDMFAQRIGVDDHGIVIERQRYEEELARTTVLEEAVLMTLPGEHKNVS